jgi:hypothetical protein
VAGVGGIAITRSLESRILNFPGKMRLVVGDWLLAIGDLDATNDRFAIVNLQWSAPCYRKNAGNPKPSKPGHPE